MLATTHASAGLSPQRRFAEIPQIVPAIGVPAGALTANADGLRVGDGVAVEHVEGHGDDLGLELGLARAHVAL